MRIGNTATTTAAIRQLSTKAITNAVTASAVFWTSVDTRSAIALRTSVASVASLDESEPVLFSSLSNHPISLHRMAVEKLEKKSDGIKHFVFKKISKRSRLCASRNRRLA